MVTTDHECEFHEIVLEEIENDDGTTDKDVKVLLPCECGETPYDEMGVLKAHADDMQRVVLNLEPHRFLFHWAPAARRKQIERYGLRPNMRPSIHTDGWKAAVICLADSPSWAWALSGNQRHAVPGEWDLWQTSLNLLTDPQVLPAFDRPSGIYEVRTEHRVYKRNLWLVGSRYVANPEEDEP